MACSLAVVGAQYRSRLAAVLSLLDQLTEQTDRVPLAVFLLSEDEGDVMEDINLTLRHPFSPLLVSPGPYVDKETDISTGLRANSKTDRGSLHIQHHLLWSI